MSTGRPVGHGVASLQHLLASSFLRLFADVLPADPARFGHYKTPPGESMKLVSDPVT